MWQIIAFLLILGLIVAVFKWIGAALYIIFFYVVMPIVGFWIFYVVIRSIYHALNPEAKRAYLERKAKEAKENQKRKEQGEAEAKAKQERVKAANRRKEYERKQHRDGDQQNTPYTYQIRKHGNESLAIRYGIANQERKVKEYWYYAKGGEQKRNPDRDNVYYEPANTVRLQKTRKVSKDLYEVLLTDFSDRKARAIIETGTEYVKTFYPLDDSWFEKYADLEETLKGNNSFTLKELATFHVQKAVGT
jgi:membrane protein implicated in regulation of membrane protease activity